MFTAITITRLLMEFFIGRKEQTLNYASSAKKAVTNYIKHSKKFFAVSGALVIAAFVLMGTIGFNPGIDFTGGSLIQAEFAAETTKEEIASTFEASAEQTELELGEVQVVESEGNSFVIKTKQIDPDKYTELITAAATQLPEFTISRFNSIGPTIGESLQKRAIQAIVLAIIMIIAYITFAFRKVPKSVRPWKFGVAAIVALVHDVVIVTGIFVILGYTMGVEINALYITAMLTVFGYSVNDTIVVLDRFRENLMQKRSNEDLADVANRSLSETMARSINTSVSTLITLIAILIWGSESIFFFVLALTLGAFVGTYSSLFIATPLLAKWNEKK
jgi:preprotein translocase subunit SecF